VTAAPARALAAVASLAGSFCAAGCGDRAELLGTEVAPGDDGGLAAESGAIAERIIVAADGTGQFTTVQAAVDSIPDGSAVPVEIDIRPGTYDEKINISGRAFLSLVGDDPLTTVLTYGDDATSAGSTTNSASVTVRAEDFSAQNITFANSSPQSAAQAVALYAGGDREQFENCRFLSYQDTIYVASGSQYFRDCYVRGDDDYVLGAATAVFQSCTLDHSASGVAVTAPSTDPATAYGFVFFGGALTAAASVPAGSVALGRPWGRAGSSTYIGTSLGAHISGVGWIPMNNNDLTQARFAEYQTTGPGADPTSRAPTSRQLTDAQAAAVTLSAIYGGWIPSFSR
jgi:pectin methylesterase-like acyl-CoA thioesterase